jgi:NH(3)-dependent NAD(+) synthetase (EC 6.3.1.5)
MMLGLADYVNKNGFPGVVLGLSGGIDSAVSAAVAVDALGAERVRAVMLPSPYTSRESLEDAAACARRLGIRYDTIPITPAIEAFHQVLAPVFGNRAPDITEENIQSRSRGLILMALSNKFGDVLLTTGTRARCRSAMRRCTATCAAGSACSRTSTRPPSSRSRAGATRIIRAAPAGRGGR